MTKFAPHQEQSTGLYLQRLKALPSHSLSASSADSQLCREPSCRRPQRPPLSPTLLLIPTCVPVTVKVIEEAERISLLHTVQQRCIPTFKALHTSFCRTDADRVGDPVRIVVSKPVPIGSRLQAPCLQVIVLGAPTLSTQRKFRRIFVRPTRIVNSSVKGLRATVRATSQYTMATLMHAETSWRRIDTIAMHSCWHEAGRLTIAGAHRGMATWIQITGRLHAMAATATKRHGSTMSSECHAASQHGLVITATNQPRRMMFPAAPLCPRTQEALATCIHLIWLRPITTLRNQWWSVGSWMKIMIHRRMKSPLGAGPWRNMFRTGPHTGIEWSRGEATLVVTLEASRRGWLSACG